MTVEAQRISPAPIRRTIRVRAAREKAFDTFAGSMGDWWLKSHSLLASPQRDVVVEPRAGGRWYEVGEDGRARARGTVDDAAQRLSAHVAHVISFSVSLTA